MKDRLMPPAYEIKDELVIKADKDTMQNVIDVLEQTGITYRKSYMIDKPYFITVSLADETDEIVKIFNGQWLHSSIERIADIAGVEVETMTGRSFRELANDKNREVEEYRAILRAHAEAIDHITAFGFSDYHNLTNEIINTQSMLTLNIRLTQIEEDLSDIASVLHRMADTASETNEQHTKKER